MSLSPGDHLGGYEIVDLLGEGGMGTVYRAHDPRLGRDVAIKVVRPVFASDPDRASRFEREARLLASLNHPHIATVYGFEQGGGTTFLVLELVEGDSLEDRLHDGSLPGREALRLALQIASAIEAAHERGIIHRDLKPSNIKITRSGDVKVLDFGLAKALALDSAMAATRQAATQTAGTQDGIILGTAAYMSPEQARGKDVDKRTDIWAFGCVLFDMLTGKRAFSGGTLSDTLAAVLTRDPDWSLLPPGLPVGVPRLLRRCLEKDVNRRLRDIGDARLEIEEALAESGPRPLSSDLLGEPREARSAVARWLVSRGALAALLAGLVLGAGALYFLRPAARSPEGPEVQFAVLLPQSDRLAGLDFQMVAMSAAETHVAYIATRRGRQQLFVRPLASLSAQPLAGTDGALNPFFSPDGQWIAFFAAGKLKKVPVSGGAVVDITDAEVGLGGVWATDGTIIFAGSNASALSRVSADGGPAQPLTTLDTARGEFSHRWPALMDDGTSVLFTVGTVGEWDDAEIAVQPLAGGAHRVVLRGGTYPRWLATGQLAYAHRNAIHLVGLNPGSFAIDGKDVEVLQDVQQSVDGAAQFAVSRSGGLVYAPRGGPGGRTLAWVDRGGNAQPLAAPPGDYTSPRLSPDGKTIALGINSSPEQVWTYSVSDTTLVPLTNDGGAAPVWSADGQRIFFSAARGAPADVFVKAADGSSGERRVVATDRTDIPSSVSPVDGSLLFVGFDTAAGRDILLLDANAAIRPLLGTPANESAPVFARDGRTFAYVSDETGRNEVFVASIDRPRQHVQVSTDGGAEPVWRRDGTELFFRSGTRMMAAAVRSRPALAASPARLLFEGTFERGVGGSPAYDVSADGMRFLMLKPVPSNAGDSELRVILHWRADAKRKE